MTETEFWHSTPRYFRARQRAQIERFRTGWEQSRFLAFNVVKTVDSENYFRRVTDIILFPWDATPEPLFQPISEAELKPFSDEADEVLKKTNPAAWEAFMKAKAEKEAHQ